MTPELAKQICINAHKGQWRKPTKIKTDSWDCYKQKVEFIHENGNKIVWCNADTFLVYEPYSNHPIAVADMLNTDNEKILAYLQDIIEDTSITFDDLLFAGANNNCLEALMLLTHVINEDYKHYIQKICINKLATKVKIADLTCNLLDNPSQRQKSKYSTAMQQLLKSL